MPLQPMADAISVQPGRTCLEEERLERRVARWLERDAVDARVHVDVFGGEGPRDVRFVVRRVGEEPAQRKLQSVPEPCDQMHAAVALSVALAIDAALLDTQDVSDDQALGPAADEDGPPPVPDAPPDPNAYRPRFSLGLGAGFSSGMVPGEAPVGVLVGAFSPVRWLSLRLGAMGTGAAGIRFAAVPVSGSYTAWLAGGRFEACAVTVATERLAIDTCLGSAAGAFLTRGTGFPTDFGTDRSLWATVFGGVSGALGVYGPLAIAVGVELHAPLQSRTIELPQADGSMGVSTALSPLGLAATFGLRYDLGDP